MLQRSLDNVGEYEKKLHVVSFPKIPSKVVSKEKFVPLIRDGPIDKGDKI